MYCPFCRVELHLTTENRERESVVTGVHGGQRFVVPIVEASFHTTAIAVQGACRELCPLVILSAAYW